MNDEWWWILWCLMVAPVAMDTSALCIDGLCGANGYSRIICAAGGREPREKWRVKDWTIAQNHQKWYVSCWIRSLIILDWICRTCGASSCSEFTILMHLAQVGSFSDKTHRPSSKGLEILDEFLCESTSSYASRSFVDTVCTFPWFPVCNQSVSSEVVSSGLKCPCWSFHGSRYGGGGRISQSTENHSQNVAWRALADVSSDLRCSLWYMCNLGSASVPQLLYPVGDWIRYWIIDIYKYQKSDFDVAAFAHFAWPRWEWGGPNCWDLVESSKLLGHGALVSFQLWATCSLGSFMQEFVAWCFKLENVKSLS